MKQFWQRFLRLNPFTIIISVIINVGAIFLFLKYWEGNYFYTSQSPDAQWWTALAAITSISFVVIGLGVSFFFREISQQAKFLELKGRIEDMEVNVSNHLKLTSSILDTQVVAENKSEEIWDKLITTTKGIGGLPIDNIEILVTWSKIAWQQGHFEKALKMRNTAFEQDQNNFRARTMLISILCNDKIIDKTRIEKLIKKTECKDDDEKCRLRSYRAKYYSRIENYKKCEELISKNIQSDFSYWAYRQYLINQLKNEKITRENIKETVEHWIEKGNNKWTEQKFDFLSQRPFMMFIYSFIGINDLESFYNLFSVRMVAELASKYNNDYDRLKLDNIFKNIEAKYKDEELQLLYLTFYYFIGTSDKEADKALNDEKTLKKIYAKLDW